MSAESAPAGFVELLRINAPFRRFFAARVVSLFGDWFNLIAILALLRELVGPDARSFGFVLISKTLPAVFVAPLAGVVVDRVQRKRLLVVLDLLRAVLVLGLLALPALGVHATSLGIPAVAVLYALVILQAACVPVSEPARNAITPDLVRPQDLVTANALGAAAWSLMFTVGMAMGGLATTYLGWRMALVVDLCTFLLSATLIATTSIPDHRDEPDHGEGDSSFREGLRFMAARPRLWTLALAKAGWSFAGGITLVLTVLGERVFPVGGKALLGVTVLYMARGVGTGLGPILSRSLCGADAGRGERIIGWSYVWAAGCYLLLGWSPWLPAAVVLVSLAHLGGATVWVFSTVRLQALTPTKIRGRVFATEQALWTVTMAVSIYAFSLAIDGEWAPLPTITSALGVVLVVPGLLWLARSAWLGDPPRPQPKR